MTKIATMLRVAAAAGMLHALAACTPQAMLASALLPDGAASALLSHLQSEPEGNRKIVASMEAKKDWDGLVKLAEENLKQDRRVASWWFVAGYSHAQAGRHQQAAECFKEMAELSPDDIEGWELFAQELLASGQAKRAVQTLTNALRVRDNSPPTWLLLGRGYEDLARSDLAFNAYRTAIKLDGELAQAWLGYGRTSARLNRRADYEQAIKALEKLDPPLAKQLAEMRPASR